METPRQEKQRLAHRRHFLQKCSTGLGGLALASLLQRDLSAAQEPEQESPPFPNYQAKAKRVIWLHMAGAPSQLDLFDHKPKLQQLDGEKVDTDLIQMERFAFIKGVPKILGSPYQFSRHGESGQLISELLPNLSKIADEISIVRSLYTTQFNHAPAQLFMNTGHQLVGRPSMGSWLSYGLGTENQDLPAFVVLLSGQFAPSGGASCWGSGFLPTMHQGVRFRSQGDPVLYLSDPSGMDRAGRRRTLDALKELNQQRYQELGDPEIQTRIAQYELSYRMQASVPELVDFNRESKATLDRYGVQPDQPSFARNCLLARRLVERGVRFVQLYHWGWDSHGTGSHDDIVTSLPKRCRETDQASVALVQDLKERGLLEDTLVVWGGEFGRTPMNEERDGSKFLGRDHHGHAFTMWLAGGGIKAGYAMGATDELGYHVVEDKVSVHDLHATMLHLLGIDHTKLTFFFQGREFRLTDVHGELIQKLLA
ncbi:MAG: DUF1501 domain-containing protein [Planctomycetota bacterium]|nr:MAG: DUF1501 domain-containing protein [Planctomycetota bacterium]